MRSDIKPFQPFRLHDYELIRPTVAAPWPRYGYVNRERKCLVLRKCWQEAVEGGDLQDLTEPVKPCCQVHKDRIAELGADYELAVNHLLSLALSYHPFRFVDPSGMKPKVVEQAKDMIKLVRKHEQTGQVWIADFEAWPGTGNYAAVPLQGSIINAFDPRRRATFNITYGLNRTELRQAHDAAVATHPFAKFRQTCTLNRLFGTGHDDPLNGMRVSDIKATLLNDLSINFENCLLVYWGRSTWVDVDSFARLLNEGQSIMQDKHPIPWSFGVLP